MDIGKEQQRRNSILWGCPEWVKSNEYDASKAASDAENVYNGYGMQYYPRYFETGQARDLANVSYPNPSSWPYHKATIWKRHGSERGLIADSQWDIIWLSASPSGFSMSKTRFQPYYAPGFTAPGIIVDARHVRRGSSRQVAVNTPSLNMLFCDGHAAPVTPPQAYDAIHNPGQVNHTP
jgi:prepilin-type processing-associated H-X9-DG protein